MLYRIHTAFGDISTFALFSVLGICSMLLYTHFLLKKLPGDYKEAERFIYPRIIISGSAGLLFAGLFDSLFKYFEYGTFEFKGITFYGGFFPAVLVLCIQIRVASDPVYKTGEWFNLLTKPFVAFHFFGRIGCFFSGCCYGKMTDSIFGVRFPDNLEINIIHNGSKCYPTQLFEAFALLLILLVLHFVKKQFVTYIVCYAFSRFFLEFFRGDDRGVLPGFLSPAQTISVITVIVCGSWYLIKCAEIGNKQKQ